MLIISIKSGNFPCISPHRFFFVCLVDVSKFYKAVLHGRKQRNTKTKEDAEDMILYKESFSHFIDEKNPSSERSETILSCHCPRPQARGFSHQPHRIHRGRLW